MRAYNARTTSLLILLVSVGCNPASEESPAPEAVATAETPATSEAAPRQSTPFPGRFFKTELPGDWRPVVTPLPHALSYGSADQKERWTATELEAPAGRETTKRGMDFLGLIESRRRAEKRASLSTALEEVQNGERGGILFAKWQSFDAEKNHRAATMVWSTSGYDLVLHYEALGLEEARFLERAQKVMNGVQLKQARDLK